MMHLYLVQHGESLPKDIDPERKLSEIGIKETEEVAKFLSRVNISINKIFHSGKTRARMTAEIFGKYLNVSDIIETDGLSPLDNPKIWLSRLSEYEEDIMLVGHLPHLAKLTALILNVDREVVKFRYSGVLCLYKEESGRWIIMWYITPDLIYKTD